MIQKLIDDLAKYRIEDIAARTGYSFSAVYGFVSGRNKNPTYNFVEALKKFLQENK